MKKESIDLSVVRIISGIVPPKGRFSFQLMSTNLSASTTFSLQFSLDNKDWDTAQESGADVTDTLVVNECKIKSFESDPMVHWRVLFSGVTTGVVTYVL